MDASSRCLVPRPKNRRADTREAVGSLLRTVDCRWSTVDFLRSFLFVLRGLLLLLRRRLFVVGALLLLLQVCEIADLDLGRLLAALDLLARDRLPLALVDAGVEIAVERLQV